MGIDIASAIGHMLRIPNDQMDQRRWLPSTVLPMVEIDWHFFECRFHFFFLPDCFLFSTVVVVVVVGLARIQKEMSSRVQRVRELRHTAAAGGRDMTKTKAAKTKQMG